MCKDKNKGNKKEQDLIDEFDDFQDNEFLDAVEAEEKRKKGEISQEEFDKLKFIKEARANIAGHDA